jgi:uncharacterized protein YkwD
MRFSLGALMLALIAVTAISLTTAAAQQTNNSPIEADAVIASLNTWRVELGLWPLQPDATLTRMAVDHATYLMTLAQLPAGGAIHNDAQGRTPRERAIQSPYNWVPYGQEAAVNEIAYVGATVRRAIDFWQGSDIHTRTVRNAAYRQVGAAAIPHRFGFLYIVVLGGQPNVLPAIADVVNGRLYLSNDTVQQERPPRLRSATQVQVFDSAGRPLSNSWLTWQSYLPLPQGVGDFITVMYSDGARFSLTTVNLTGQTGLFNTQIQRVVEGIPATPVPPATGVAALPATPTLPFELPPTIPPTAITAGSTLEPTRANANVALYYSARTLTLHNITDAPLNVSNITLQGGGTSLRTAIWQTAWLSGSLEALAGRDCVQLWAWTEPAELPREAACRQRRGVVTVSVDRMFWRTNDISVYQGDRLLATCPRANNQCSFFVPR